MTLLHQAAQKAVEALTREIMNMRGELEDDWSQAERGCYKLGHRDARHEAVALVNDAIAALESALQQQPEPVAWIPYLADRADGVRGHYAISRWNPGTPASAAPISFEAVDGRILSGSPVRPHNPATCPWCKDASGVTVPVSQPKAPSGTDGGSHPLPAQANDGGEHG